MMIAVSCAELQSASERELRLQHKPELALPIMPPLPGYKVELATGSDVDLNAVKNELKE